MLESSILTCLCNLDLPNPYHLNRKFGLIGIYNFTICSEIQMKDILYNHLMDMVLRVSPSIVMLINTIPHVFMWKLTFYSHEIAVNAVFNIHHICINLLVPRYTKTNIGNPGNKQN